jgi:tetratricopeptide (TPR) repeat protein
MDPQKPPTLAEVAAKLLEDNPRIIAGFCGAIALLVLLMLVAAWLIWGRGPRRRRGLRAARKQLKAGSWQDALDQLKRLRAVGSPSASWLKTFDAFEAECLQAASQAAIDDKKFENALELGHRAAQILDEPEHEVRVTVQNAMLREIRRLYAKTGETHATIDLIARTLKVQSPCREASFWLAMCQLRNGLTEQGLKQLQIARTGVAKAFSIDDGFSDAAAPGAPPAPPSTFIDPALYLGALLLRKGQAKESLRFLTEANRMDANCPFITLQLGAAIVTAGGDTKYAVRALQRSLGPKGFGMWRDDPHRAWVEGFPENRSYIRKLASEFAFTCPVFGDDLKFLFRQGNLALAQGQFKLGNFKEAADLFDKVLKEGAPSLPVLRGLGLSLAKLGRYDDAFVHLRTAHEMEEEKERLTAGYLALCGAAGKPSRPEDKLENIAWAVRLATNFNAPGDAEWVGILNRIFAEARQNSIPLTSDDQLYLCEHLVSLKSSDALSAQAYHFLMATEPGLLRPEYAWLYCRADQEHDVNGDQAIALYTVMFANAEPARAFYAEQGWDFDDVERMFLRRAAEKSPGRFPEVLGPDYTPRGEQLLLAKAQQQEETGEREAGLATIEILVKLSPSNTSAMDRAAGLHYRAGRIEPAYQLLEQWHQAQPTEPMPLVRQAILLHQQGHEPTCFGKLQDAMNLSQGRRRANIAFLGARLAMQSWLVPNPNQTVVAGVGTPTPAMHLAAESGVGIPTPATSGTLPAAIDFLTDCLTHDPNHAHAQWCLAAVRWLQGDTAALAGQGEAMSNAEVTDPRYHYLAALCHLLGSRHEAVVAACKRVGTRAGSNGSSTQRQYSVEAGYLAALAQVAMNHLRPAIDALKPLTFDPKSPTLPYAQALLGEVLFREKRHDEAISAWQALDTQKRQAWNLAGPMAQTTFISALESMQKGQYEQAAEKLRQAGRLGFRDRRLGPLLLLALFKAGQQAIYKGETAPVPTPRPNSSVPDGDPVAAPSRSY